MLPFLCGLLMLFTFEASYHIALSLKRSSLPLQYSVFLHHFDEQLELPILLLLSKIDSHFSRTIPVPIST